MCIWKKILKTKFYVKQIVKEKNKMSQIWEKNLNQIINSISKNSDRMECKLKSGSFTREREKICNAHE